MPREICEKVGCVKIKLAEANENIHKYENLHGTATDPSKIVEYTGLVTTWSTVRSKIQKYTVQNGFCEDCPAVIPDGSASEG